MRYQNGGLRRVILAALTISVAAIFSGCATQSLESQVASNVDLSDIRTVFVEKLAADERGIEKLIASELNRMGIEATSGPMYPSDGDFDARVTYADKWMWDVTMYMIELRVQIQDPDTNFVLASGHSFRTSLVRKSPEEMVAEVLGDIFK